MESILPFDEAPRELWIQFLDRESYEAAAPDLQDLLRESDGNSQVILYLRAEKAKKRMGANWSVGIREELLDALRKKFGAENVKVVEKTIEMR